MKATLEQEPFMRVVFMGTPGISGKSLKRLYSDGHDVAAVFTQPDRPKGRGMQRSFSPVKELALEYGTPVYQPVSMRDGIAEGILDDLKCDLVVVVAFGKILPREVLEKPPFGSINIHGSLLPEYRGAAPAQWAILNGEKVTGVTSLYMNEGIDAGDMIFSRPVPIGDEETAGDLLEKLGDVGAQLLSETVDAIASGSVVRRPQDHSKATFAPALTRAMSQINWTDSAYRIKCRVRGLRPWPGASAELQGRLLKVLAVDIDETGTGRNPGDIVFADKRGIGVACADGVVVIRELQAPGGKHMNSADYIRGHLF